MDDIRNHDTHPTEEESAWMETEGLGTVVRACVLGAVALMVGLGASMLVEDTDLRSDVAIFGPH